MEAGRENEQVTHVEEAWVPLRDAIEHLGVEGLERPTTAGWTAKEMLAHVAFWQEAFEYVLEVMFRGGETRPGYGFGSGYWPDEDRDWPHFDEHNAREAEWARGQSAAAVLSRLHAARDRHRDLLRTLTDAELADERFVSLVDEEAKHMREHLPELESLLP